MFFENGFHNATVDDVAQQAEVSKGTIYLYFESKETLLALLLLEGLNELVEQLKQAHTAAESLPADEQLQQLGQAYLHFFEQEPQYFQLLTATDRGKFQETVSPQTYQKVLQTSMEGLNWVIQAVEQGIENGLFEHCEANQAAATLWATMNGVLELMEHPLRREIVGVECETLCQIALETIIRGLKTPLGNDK